ncbi:MAG: L,D-transpeptidase [Firmicutes bacterium]|nr:L,D-transpeptidase [Bacillota bacterium]MCM1401283.1 L,D-transpeptidase [Bacteroides sp.]MCM1476762.1 L,D-transpeptidase [Bacteroides sp.]
MRTLFLLSAGVLTLLSACSQSGKSSDSMTVAADSVVTAMDTATALPDSTPKQSKPAGPLLDSLASAETTLNFMKNSGHWDKYRQGIIPTIMDQSLDYARRLLRSTHDHFIIVDKQSMNVILYDKYGREEKCYKMACSRYYGTKHKRRDNRTPEGFFSASGIYNSTDWLYTNDDGYTSPARGQFGPRFIRLKTPVTTQVGIHGTSARHSPGHRVSHGCIRIQNEQILELVKYATVGMPIIVNPSDRDRKVNESEGVHVTQLNIGKGINTPEPKEDKKDKSKEEASEKETKADSTATTTPATENVEAPVKENAAEEPAKTDTPKPTEPEKNEPAKSEPTKAE